MTPEPRRWTATPCASTDIKANVILDPAPETWKPFEVVEAAAYDDLKDCLAEVYDYMVEVEGALLGHIAVRSYLSLPRTDEERVAIGERARKRLGRETTSL